MKELISVIVFSLLFFACKKEEQEPVITTPDHTPTLASDVEIDVVSEIDACGYTVLDDCFIGSWNKSTIVSSDGNVIIVGSARTGFSQRKIVLVKTDTTGEILYYKTVFNDQYGKGLGVCEDSNQNMYVVGYTLGDDGSQSRMLAVAKLNIDGGILWEKNYHPMEEGITGYNVAEMPNGEIVVSGSLSGNVVFLKINPAGEEILFDVKESSSYGTPNGMLVLEDGRILITNSSGEELQLSWYNEDLDLLQEKQYGSRISYGRSTIQLSEGDLLSVGKFIYAKEGSNIIDSQAVLLIKVGVEGELIWERKVGNVAYGNDGQSIKENADGTFVLNGYSDSNHMLIYVDSEGNEINAKYFLDDKTFRGENIIKTESGRNIMTGGYQGGMFFLNVDNYGM